jgi:small subunit ribosomal protein S1
MTESFAELFEQSQSHLANLKPGAIVTGTVVDVRNDVVVINAGLKSEGIVPIEQFRNDDGEIDVGIGDQVKVALDALENGFGETILSREKAKRAMVWDELEEALEKNETITGRISGKVKGGFTVDIKDVRAFLPGSLVDVRPVRDPAYLEGKELEFKLIKLDRKRNNVVVSRRAVVESEHSEEREQLMEKLVEGAVLKGVVKNLTDYGAFVDLGGIDGLLHITDMAWKRVRHPSEVVEVGAELDVRVLKYDRERNRVSLGLKQLGEDPWDNIARRYPATTRVFGKVSNVTDYGAFVEIEPGVEGLVHVSEMDWTNKNVNPSKVVPGRRRGRGHGPGRRRGAPPHLAGHEAVSAPTRGRPSPRSTRRATRSTARSSRSPTSASSSAWTAASTAWCTCRTSAGTPPARMSSATTRRATPWRPWCWRWTRSANASRWASSSSNRIRSASSWPRTRRAPRSPAP